MPHNLHDTLQPLKLASGATGRFHSLPALEKAGIGRVSRLPVSIRIVLESVLRNCDGKKVTAEHVQELANWAPTGARTAEIPFVVARVVLQDFTGVPLLADLAAMRNVAADMGKNPKAIEPLVPVDLVVDHSVMIDYYRRPDALDLNMKLEFQRNAERYQFMKWGMQAFDTFKVVPPGIGIVHQVNLEYLARGVHEKDGVYYPDTLVGTDSHTTMINGIGVVGWGVGGIEAEAGMLGQPVYFLTPDVVGVELKGRLNEGITATDLVLTVTEMLRREKVVGKFVEFFGEGTASLAVPDRATIANMAPEYGATMGFFPVDDATVDYLKATGRTAAEIDAFAAYFKAQGLYGIPRAGDIDYTKVVTLDLASIRASVAGPKRPQDRIELGSLKAKFTELFSKPVADNGFAPARREPRQAAHHSRRRGSRQRRRADRRDHVVHEHLQSRRPARRGPARQEGGRKGPHRQAAHQDIARPGLARGHRLPDQSRPPALSRAARLRRDGVRLHDVHRQCRRPAAGVQRGDHRQRPRLRGGPFGQPQFRGAHPPEPQGEFPGVAAARRRVCHRGHRAEGSDDRAGRHGHERPGVPQGPLADVARDRGRDELRQGPRHLPRALRRRRQREPAVGNDLRRDRTGLRLAGVDVHREAAVLRGLQDGDRQDRRHQGRARARDLRRFRDHRSHQPGRARSSRPPPPASICSSTTWRSSTSTAMARAAATTT